MHYITEWKSLDFVFNLMSNHYKESHVHKTNLTPNKFIFNYSNLYIIAVFTHFIQAINFNDKHKLKIYI